MAKGPMLVGKYDEWDGSPSYRFPQGIAMKKARSTPSIDGRSFSLRPAGDIDPVRIHHLQAPSCTQMAELLPTCRYRSPWPRSRSNCMWPSRCSARPHSSPSAVTRHVILHPSEPPAGRPTVRHSYTYRPPFRRCSRSIAFSGSEVVSFSLRAKSLFDARMAGRSVSSRNAGRPPRFESQSI